MEFLGSSVVVLASLALSIAVGIPAWSLLALTLASLARSAGARAAGDAAFTRGAAEAPCRAVVLIPAHNESVHLIPTLQCLQAQRRPGDRVLVVADNCNDDTAAIARQHGAQVLERHDTRLRGKGYALAHGVDALRSDPPDVLVIVDADCTLSAGGLAALVQDCHRCGQPVQMLDLMVAPQGSGLRTRLLEFAWTIKNHVRPLGSFRLGGACHLMGTGMALPWQLAASAQLATGHIAEDMKLGVDMAVAGHPTRFLASACVTSVFPTDAATARTQKSRWEHGHLTTLKEELPRLLAAWLRQRRRSTFVLAMDLVIPPLALYFLLSVATLAGLLLLTLLQPALAGALVVASCSSAAFFAAILLSWWRYGRHLLRLEELLAVPWYAAWKIPVYLAYFFHRKSGWTKTARKV